LLATDVGLEARSLAAQVAEVVELGAPGAATPDDGDAVDEGRVDGEHALYALAERHLTDGDGAACALAVLAGNDDAFEGLDAAAGAFYPRVIRADGLARVEVGEVVTQVGLLDRAQDRAFVVVHLKSPGGRPAPLRRCGSSADGRLRKCTQAPPAASGRQALT